MAKTEVVWDVVFVVEGQVVYDCKVVASSEREAVFRATREAISESGMDADKEPEVHVRPFS